MSSESPPEELDRVRGLVFLQLVEFGDWTTSVETVWSDKAKMWFVEVRPHNPDAAFISIGVEGDTVFLHAGDDDAESWGRGGEPPYDWLQDRLTEIMTGRVRFGRWRTRSFAPY